MESFVVGMVFLGIPTIIGWVIKNHYAHQRFMKVLHLKSEMNARLLDRLGTDPGVLDVLKSDVQQKMFEITLPEAAEKMPAAHARMLTSAQVGVMLLSLGGGFLYIRQFVESRNDSEFVLVLGTIAFALGIGAILSAVAAYLATRLWQTGVEGVDRA
jgi:ActR/RegA family two-component response regulator